MCFAYTGPKVPEQLHYRPFEALFNIYLFQYLDYIFVLHLLIAVLHIPIQTTYQPLIVVQHHILQLAFL